MRIFVPLGFCFFLSACGTLPNLPPEDNLPVSLIVDAVQCELHEALVDLQPQYKFLSDWLIGANFTFVGTESATVSPDLGLVIPIFRAMRLAGGTFNIGAHLDFTGTAKRTVNFKLGFSFAQIAALECPNGKAVSRGLASNLGIHEWLKRTLSAIDGDDHVGEPLAVGTTIQYTAIDAGKITPTLTLQRLTDVRKTTPSALISAGRTDDQTLDIALTPAPRPQKPKPVEVIIVGKK